MKGFTVTCFPAQVCPSEEMLTQLGFAPRLGMATHSSGSSSTFEMKSSAPFSQPVAGFAGHACRLPAHDMKSCTWRIFNSGSRAAARIARRISSLAEAIFDGTGELFTALPARGGLRERSLAVGSARRGLRERSLVPCNHIYQYFFFGETSATFRRSMWSNHESSFFSFGLARFVVLQLPS